MEGVVVLEKWNGSSATDIQAAVAKAVVVTDDTLSVELSDGRTIFALLAWFPRLSHGTLKERQNRRFIGAGRRGPLAGFG